MVNKHEVEGSLAAVEASTYSSAPNTISREICCGSTQSACASMKSEHMHVVELEVADDTMHWDKYMTVCMLDIIKINHQSNSALLLGL